MRACGAWVAALMLAGLGLTAPANAVAVGDDGCTPGYWKNHPENWQEVKPGDLLKFDHNSTAFPPFMPTDADLDGSGTDDTFLAALSFKGGSGLVGAEQILFRAAVAAWLNAAYDDADGFGYPLRRKDFVPEVNAAIASGDRQTMLDLAAELDALNNLGCPL
ncbi:MAG: hypothetical protein M3419_02280 [Actinomycetota bacterium]|nr:hypothetical protein [Actinomycetota bacterium]